MGWFNTLLRLGLAVLGAALVVLRFWFPDTLVEVSAQVESAFPFENALLVIAGFAAFVFLCDAFGAMFLDGKSEDDEEKQTFLQRLTERRTPRFSQVAGLVKVADWGAYLADIEEKLGKQPKVTMVPSPPDEKGMRTITLTEEVTGYTDSRMISCKDVAAQERLIREAKIKLMHGFITSQLQQEVVVPEYDEDEEEEVTPASNEPKPKKA